MEKLKIACKKCGCDEALAFKSDTGQGMSVLGHMVPIAFLTVHLNGCHQAEVESGNPPMLADIFELKGERDGQ